MLRKLKNTDLNIFPIVMGSDYYGSAVSQQTAFENMDLYIGKGGNIIDTARLYVGGESEKIIGRYIASRGLKNKLIISTKAAHPPIGHMDINRLGREDIESDVDSSLSALGIDCIDILWLHRDDTNVPAEQIVDSMDKIIKKGKVKYWGVSNWTGERIELANKYAAQNNMPQIIGGQIQWSLARCCLVPDPTLVSMNGREYEHYKKHKMPVFAYASQGKGFFEKFDSGTLSEKARDRYLCEENVNTYELLAKVRSQTGYSLTALGLSYLIRQKNFDVFPIIGCSKTEYVLKAMETFEVTDDAMEEIMKIMP